MRFSELRTQIHKTLERPVLSSETVVNACHQLSEKIASGDYQQMIEETGLSRYLSPQNIQEASRILNREFLCRRLNMELGTTWNQSCSNRFPLGVLFHIGAGNMDGLSAYSVIEGLLTGNINLLKLPAAERGISALLLRELIRIEPALGDYIYVFDFPSSNQKRLKQLMELSDAVVLWGGDEAVTSVRALAPPNTQLIEWRHKLSFAYVTESGMDSEEELLGLAVHMIETGQVLCSSCQGIYLDTDRPEVPAQFARRFLSLLNRAHREHAVQNGKPDLGAAAQNTLRVQEACLTAMINSAPLPYTDGCVSVTVSSDSALTPSLMFGNCWVKPLPREQIVSTLHEQKGYLQTVGLICGDKERSTLSYLLFRAGAVRICAGRDMSHMPENGAHDGEYPLRKYQKLTSNN